MMITSIYELKQIIKRDVICIICGHKENFISVEEGDKYINCECMCGAMNIFDVQENIQLFRFKNEIGFFCFCCFEGNNITTYIESETDIQFDCAGFIPWCNFDKYKKMKNFL